VPELPAGYLAPLPLQRPVGLRRRRLPAGTEMWRIDDSPPNAWTWHGFPAPRYRFDPASGAFRVRYAGGTMIGAFREKYRDSGLFLPADHAGHHFVRLVASRDLRVLDLRNERNLDVLGVDDQISTGHHPAVWTACHQLADAVHAWWDDLDAIVYRPRTTPATSVNIAFFATDPFLTDSSTLAEAGELLAEVVLHHGFTVGWNLTG